MQDHATGHPKVGQELHAVVQQRHDVFRAPRQRDHTPPGKPPGKTLGERLAEIRSTDHHLGQGRTLKVWSQAADHGFDFWQFWHRFCRDEE